MYPIEVQYESLIMFTEEYRVNYLEYFKKLISNGNRL